MQRRSWEMIHPRRPTEDTQKDVGRPPRPPIQSADDCNSTTSNYPHSHPSTISAKGRQATIHKKRPLEAFGPVSPRQAGLAQTTAAAIARARPLSRTFSLRLFVLWFHQALMAEKQAESITGSLEDAMNSVRMLSLPISSLNPMSPRWCRADGRAPRVPSSQRLWLAARLNSASKCAFFVGPRRLFYGIVRSRVLVCPWLPNNYHLAHCLLIGPLSAVRRLLLELSRSQGKPGWPIPNTIITTRLGPQRWLRIVLDTPHSAS